MVFQSGFFVVVVSLLNRILSIITISASFTIAGDEGWGGKCSLGRRQSPIDLAEDASIVGKYEPLKFDNYEDVLKNAKVRNTGHSCKYYLYVHVIRTMLTPFFLAIK